MNASLQFNNFFHELNFKADAFIKVFKEKILILKRKNKLNKG